jgi:SAM-dependent methyltransferase
VDNQSFDTFAATYEELLKDPLRSRFAGASDFFIHQKCRVVARRLARRHGRTSLRILDAGCGLGTALAFFRPGMHVFGADVSHPMLRHAVERGPVAVQEPYDLPFADGTFDAAYAFCIYHHIPDDHHVRHLRELQRVVSAGSEVMVFEHNPYNPVTARIFARAPIDQGCHMIRPTTLRARFRDAGFRDITHGYLLFIPQSLSGVLGFLEPGLQWLPLGGQYFVSGRKPTPHK